MHGITQVEYNHWRGAHGLSHRSVRLLAENEQREIYKEEYWDKCHCDNLPVGLDYAVFDEAVNGGVARAMNALKTMKPPANPDEDTLLSEVKHFNAVRLHYLQGLHIYRYFGSGWKKRVDRVEAIAEKMIREEMDKPKANPNPTSIMKPIPVYHGPDAED